MADEMAIANGNCDASDGSSNSISFSFFDNSVTSNVPKASFTPSALIEPIGDRINNYDYDADMCDNPPLSATQCLIFKLVSLTIFFSHNSS